MMRHVKAGNVTFGNDLPLVFICGPCQIESRAHAWKLLLRSRKPRHLPVCR